MRNDPTRLAELRRCLILDSTAERAYDDLTRTLATGLGVPITMVNLLDAARDWHKSCIGLQVSESPVVTSFCEEFFQTSDDLIVVDDTHADLRFAAHPLVVGPPFVRFYAAARLRVRGQTLGTLCAYDFQPRSISADDVGRLQTLAATAVDLIGRRAA